VVFELTDRKHGEAQAEWLRSADVRQGALTAAALSTVALLSYAPRRFHWIAFAATAVALCSLLASLLPPSSAPLTP